MNYLSHIKYPFLLPLLILLLLHTITFWKHLSTLIAQDFDPIFLELSGEVCMPKHPQFDIRLVLAIEQVSCKCRSQRTIIMHRIGRFLCGRCMMGDNDYCPFWRLLFRTALRRFLELRNLVLKP